MTRAIVMTAICILALLSTSIANEPPYGGVKLLEGYKYKRSRSLDTINGVIYKDGGLRIEFESGISEGYAADPKQRTKYLWFREQMVNGHKVFTSLAKSGTGTEWEPGRPRGPKPGRILMVTFPGKFGPNDAANFYAEVLDDTEVADMLLMVLTFDPTK